MSARIRGKKREELINNWLQGKDDDEFDVIPTKNEGKYIIRHKTKNNNISEQTISEPSDISASGRALSGESEQPIPEQTISEPNNAEITEDITENNAEIKQTSVNNTRTKSMKESPSQQNLTLDILNQLKNIQSSFHEFNEERRKKQEKKAKKKEMKHIIHKEFAKNRVMIEDSDDEEEYKNNEPQVVYVEKPAPIRTRRRLNLLNRYK